MARLRRQLADGNGDRDKFDLVEACAERDSSENLVPESLQTTSRSSSRKKVVQSYQDDYGDSKAEYRQFGIVLPPRRTPKKTGTSKQRRLVPLQGSLLSMSLQPDVRPKAVPSMKLESPRRPQRVSKQTASDKLLQADVGECSDSLPEVDAEESIWCGSEAVSDESEDDLPSPSVFLAMPQKATKQYLGKTPSFQNDSDGSKKVKDTATFDSDSDIAPRRAISKTFDGGSRHDSRPASSSDKENQGAFLRFSPPRLYSPTKNLCIERPMTPPQSPLKSRLQSPSKTRTRIPTPPDRQSLDAFWNAGKVNDWNEQHSPKKILKSPRKLKFIPSDSQQSPTSSPRKAQSPWKRSKVELEAKKTFETSKHRIAETFLAELDTVVTNGKVGELSASTGGVHFVWSKTLNSTAGRANWRRETMKTTHLDGTTTSTHKHHASIELAEKVINDEDRLLNVIAHEFCHLANFMVSGIKDQPHGRQFKEWGLKCTVAFSHRGVKVTTKHSYEIDYRYIWQCSNEDCGVEFKRHSRSIDPRRHTCGSCRNKLVQIKPVPRKTGGAGGVANGYAAYVKANFAAVKKGMPGASQKEVMEAVAKKYRADKDARSLSPADDDPLEVDMVVKALEVITIED